MKSKEMVSQPPTIFPKVGQPVVADKPLSPLEKELAFVKSMPRMLGQKEMVMYLEGKHMTASQRCKALCNFCMGYFPDGKLDCENQLCPLYPKRFYKGMHSMGMEPKDEPKRK